MPETLPVTSPAGVARDNRVSERGWDGVGVEQAAAVAGGVAADGAIGQGGRVAVEQAAAPVAGGVLADGAIGQGGRAAVGDEQAATVGGGVPADGAIGQGGRAAVGVPHAAAAGVAELPLTVQLVSVAVP